MNGEIERIKRHYSSRTLIDSQLYSPMRPENLSTIHERQRAITKVLRCKNIAECKLLEVGCSTGWSLSELILLGFSPSILAAKCRLPCSVELIAGEATKYSFAPNSFDIVYQSVTFTSILENELKKSLAHTMWNSLKPGGLILWYDFLYNNPKNNNVRGIPKTEIRNLFPEGNFNYHKITLAPPISRRVCKLHPSLYTIFNTIPFLRSHCLCTIEKH